ncbi:acyl-CoA dehydrogenase family protein [Haliangium ochraceum]|uniref:Acyl-CoA dehydrogenase domain protein n=1 Tax=Haliangium ochraceum (strain DSM 14365 / JCM 11303 / SMP-2) TaxID=502025 RepID=D0LYS9_HALO1|nr:acyl-CoA dehydrogenase family protein [Haliangium ochraceum]ACY14399.1 acyl-CoA dehydrogenase domain protein [Haliangium ochraceum DSM 14365]
MAFFQQPPALGNQYDDDFFLQDYLARTLPAEVLAAVEDELRELGELSGGHFYRMQLADARNEPVHVPWDAWGQRVDRIEVSPLWREAQALAAERGLVAAAYDSPHGRFARVHQFALNYVIAPSLDVYSCPLAMTDGAARTLLSSGNQALIEHAVTRLTSRDPAQAWTSGQWMTERTGGSDVGLSETEARRDGDTWRLWGTKWFTSATTSQMALTLGRPDGNGPGGRGLALFYVELRDDDGRLRNIEVNRLKDKLGTRKVPTAELTLAGTPATLVTEEAHNGVRSITPMLNITRTWNAIIATSLMRRGLALAKDYAQRRRAFGARLAEKPLHLDTLADMQAETAGAVLLAFRAAELLGSLESGEATDSDAALARVLTPIAKLSTGKQAVTVTSEALESFGGAGYVEDTGLPRLLADAQVLPIWEGTTNVLSLDTLRALGQEDGFRALQGECERLLGQVQAAELATSARAARDALTHAATWLGQQRGERVLIEAGARRFALTLGRSLELALLCQHAQWCLDNGRGPRAAAAARRLAQLGVDLIADSDAERAADAALLLG